MKRKRLKFPILGITLLLFSISIHAQTESTLDQENELISNYSQKYFSIIVGIEPENLSSAGLTFNIPTIGIQYLRFDEDRRKGNFLKATYSRLKGERDKEYFIRDTSTNILCTFCSLDTITRVDANLSSAKIMYGWIRPLKTFGEMHRFSWTFALGYNFDNNRVDYLDDVTGWESESLWAHYIVNDIGLQYRWIPSERLMFGIEWNIFRTYAGIDKDFNNDREENYQTTLNQILAPRSVFVWVGFRW